MDNIKLNDLLCLVSDQLFMRNDIASAVKWSNIQSSASALGGEQAIPIISENAQQSLLKATTRVVKVTVDVGLTYNDCAPKWSLQIAIHPDHIELNAVDSTCKKTLKHSISMRTVVNYQIQLYIAENSPAVQYLNHRSIKCD